MAYIDATDLYDLQVEGGINEKRFAEQGLLDATKASSLAVDYIMPSDIAKMQSMDSIRSLQIPVIQDQTVVVNATPGFTFIPSNLPTSAQYTFTAYDVFSGFRHYPATYGSNSVDADVAKKAVMKNVLYAMANTVETTIATVLETRKTQLLNFATQVSQGDGTYVFNGGTDTLEINKAAQKETMFYNLAELMKANEMDGDYRIVTSRGGLAIQKQLAQMFGANNSENIAWDKNILSMDRLHESGNISAAAAVFNGWYLRDGAVGLVENYPYDFRNGTVIGGKKWSVSDMELPFLKMKANIYVNNEATDAQALISGGASSDNTMTHFEEMAIWSRFYVVYPYNSDLTARTNDVIKITGLTT